MARRALGRLLILSICVLQKSHYYIAYLFAFAWIVLLPASVYAKNDSQHQFYLMDVGVQGGAAYYVGELAPHVFMSTSETYGAQIRYKINTRFGLQLKGQHQRVVNTLEAGNEWGESAGKYKNQMWHVDVMAEYNFFLLGLNEYDIHMRPITPYMALGVGVTLMGTSWKRFQVDRAAVYLPVAIGLKWKFAERWQLQMAWQHNVYVDKNGDALEGNSAFDNTYQMNGTNIMNNDITSTLTVGLIFEFGRENKPCVMCTYDM